MSQQKSGKVKRKAEEWDELKLSKRRHPDGSKKRHRSSRSKTTADRTPLQNNICDETPTVKALMIKIEEMENIIGQTIKDAEESKKQYSDQIKMSLEIEKAAKDKLEVAEGVNVSTIAKNTGPPSVIGCNDMLQYERMLKRYIEEKVRQEYETKHIMESQIQHLQSENLRLMTINTNNSERLLRINEDACDQVRGTLFLS